MIMSTSRPSRQLVGILSINYKLENITGLLIRMPVSAQVYKIGGADQYPMTAVKKYRDVVDGKEIEVEVEVPYIPGSSLKGRMKSLVEEFMGSKLYSTDGKIWMHARYYGQRDYNMNAQELVDDIRNRCVIDEVFGSPAIHADTLEEIEKNLKIHPHSLYTLLAQTRLLVDDIFPDIEYVRKLSDNWSRILSIADFLEEKSENRLDRVTAAADPRTVVRVKPHTVFNGYMKLLIFDIDKGLVKRNIDIVFKAMRLVEETYLGGSGSRGYGRVVFKDLVLKLLMTKDGVLREEVVGRYTGVNEVLGKVEEISKLIEDRLFK
jgi:CRISPR-associated protein Csm3